MKLEGSLLSPRKFSSLKYDMTCVVCFQKFIVSCSPNQISAVVPGRPALRTGKRGVRCRGYRRGRTWYSALFFMRRTSTTGILFTNRCFSNSCRIRVRIVETGMGMLYIRWMSGACPQSPISRRSHYITTYKHQKGSFCSQRRGRFGTHRSDPGPVGPEDSSFGILPIDG